MSELKPSTRDILALLHLNPEGITALDALNDAGCFRLGARIFELKAAGYPIATDWVTTMTGKRIARYRLVRAPEQMAIRFHDAPWEAVHQNQDSTSPDFGRTWTTTGGGKASA